MSDATRKAKYRTSEKGKASARKYWDSPKGKYLRHKDNARKRGVEFSLTFDEWWLLWQASKRWAQRGWKQHQYVMCRKGDQGPYALGNVYIGLAKGNLKDARRKSVVVRRKGKTKHVSFIDPQTTPAPLAD